MTLDVKALRDVSEAATPGPWATEYEAQYLSGDVYMVHARDAEETLIARDVREADATLIVAAINALPALLDRLERAEREREEAADLLRENGGLLRARMERAERVSAAARTYMDALAAFSAACDSTDDLPTMTYDRYQSAVTAASTALRAALDDEAPR